MAQQENRRLNLELQEAKGRQEEQGAQVQRLKDKVAQMKDTLNQAQQRVVSETLGNKKQRKFQGVVVEKYGERHG